MTATTASHASLVTNRQVLHLTAAFTYNRADRTFTAEASDLGYNRQTGQRQPVFGRVWQDSTDEGFGLVSTHTGRVVTFVVWEEHKDTEGDVTHWTLKSVTGDGRRLHDGRFTATVFND